jgi:hypothetical protein
MAAITTAAAGDWSATGTWTGGTIPGNLDTVTLNHDVVVTDERTVGVSPAAGAATPAILCNATLTIATGGRLNCRGDLALNTGDFVMAAGAILEWDASAAGTPSTARYRLRWVSGSTATVTISGTSGNHAIVRSNSGGANGRIDHNNIDHAGQIAATWCDFQRIGDASNSAISYILLGSDTLHLEDCTFDADCGSIGDVTSFAETGTTIRLIRVQHLSTVADSCVLSNDNPASGSGTREFLGGDYHGKVYWYGWWGWTIGGGAVLRGGYESNNGVPGNWDGVLIVIPDTSAGDVQTGGTMKNSYVLFTGQPSNPHGTTVGDETPRLTGCIFECPDGDGSEGDGDCITFNAPSAPVLVQVDHCITVHHNNVAPGTMLSCLGGPNLTVECTHCTFHGQMGIYVGETYSGHAGMLAKAKNNLMYHKTAGSGYVILADPGSATDLVAAANADYNGKWNPNGSGYSGLNFSSGAPGVHDVSGDPQFVDVDRGIKSWDSSIGGPGTVAHALDQLGTGAHTLQELLDYVRAGFRPTNPAFRAADDMVSPSQGWMGAVQGLSDPVDQLDYRWGEDDGSESAHTWAAAQGADLTAPLGTKLLRLLLDATGDPVPITPKLKYQKNGSGGYIDVPIGSTVPAVYGTVSFGAIGTGANGSTSVAPSYPTGITAGQYLLCVVTSGATNSEVPTTPSGWTLLATGASTDGTFGVDTGPRRVTVFGKVADGTESGTLTISITNGNTCRATISRFTKAGAGAWVVDAQGGNDSTSGTGFSVTFGSMNWNTGDVAIVAVGQRVDTVTQSAQSLTASGVTFGARTNRASTAVTTGNDHRHVVDTFAAVSGTSNVDAAPTWAFTGSAACSGGAVIVRLREYTAPVNNEVYIAPSANIASGGEATTARLTPPSGKTTGDFLTGRRWDDENGSDSLDLGTDQYTEPEWAVATQSPAVDTDFFDFKVYNGDTALNAYVDTPRWTIGTGGGTISGAASITLADVTSAATGALKVQAAAGVTLADVVAAVTGALTLQASAALTLADVTLVAQGALKIQATAGITLDGVTCSAAGALTLAGAAGLALDPVTLAAAGTLPIAGAAALTLDDVTLTATGAGVQTTTGQAAVTLADVTTAAQGTLTLQAAAALTVADVTAAATGALTLRGTTGITLGDVTLTGAGVLVVAGSGQAAITLGDVTLTAASALALIGQGALTLDPVTAAGTGTVRLQAGATITLDAVTLAGSGVGTVSTAGQADLTLANVTASAAGVLHLAASLGTTLDPVTTTATGALRLSGTGAITLDPVTMTAIGGAQDLGELQAVQVRVVQPYAAGLRVTQARAAAVTVV